MTELFAGGVSRALGLALVQFVWQGAAISLAIAALFALMGRATSQARYVTGCIGLAAMMIAPVVTFSLSLSPAIPAASITVAQAVLTLAPLSEPAGVHGAIEASETALGLSSWLPAVTTLWSVGVLVLMLRLLGGWLTVRRFRTTASLAVPEVWMTKTAAVARSLGITCHVTIGASPVVDVPTVLGWIRPAILVPAGAFAGLSPFQFEAILAHELAHIRRHDYLVNVMQSVVETLLFYHPGVWWLSGRVRAEREHCCDEMAIAYCGDRVAYAGALASLEHLRLRAPIMAVAANSGDLLTRIQRVLGVQANEEQSPAVAVAIITLALLLGPLVGTVTQGALAAASPAELAAEPSQVVRDSVRALPDVQSSPEQVIPSQPAPIPTVPTARALTQGSMSFQRAAMPDAAQDLGDVERRLAEATSNLREQDRDTRALGAVRARLTVLADKVAQYSVGPLEEQLRAARVSKDGEALSRLLDADFSGTDSTGATLNRTQALEQFRNSTVRSITIDVVSGRMLDKTAFTTGRQTEVTSSGTETLQYTRVQFTRVWTNTPTGWKLQRSVEFVAAPPVAAAAAAPTGPFRVGGDVKEPRLLTPNVRPVYPEAAKAAGLQGLVIVEAIIGPDGSVTDARVIKSVVAVLDQAAVDAVSQWKYTPTLLNGTPVSVLLNATVNFSLAPN